MMNYEKHGTLSFALTAPPRKRQTQFVIRRRAATWKKTNQNEENTGSGVKNPSFCPFRGVGADFGRFCGFPKRKRRKFSRRSPRFVEIRPVSTKNFAPRRKTSRFDEIRHASTKYAVLRRKTSRFVEKLGASTKKAALRRNHARFDESGPDLTGKIFFS
jgi:hypothetical protein